MNRILSRWENCVPLDRFDIPALVLVAMSAAACGANGSGGADAASAAGNAGQDSGVGVSPVFDAGSSSGTDAGGSVANNADDGGGSDSGSNMDLPTPVDGGGSGSEASVSSEAGVSDGGHGNKILIYTVATGYVHASIPDTATGLANAATTAGLVPEKSVDRTKFATGGLSQYAGVVLVANSGAPFGSPGTTEIQTLIDFVRGGGGLVALEDANHAYTAPQYISLIGGEFNGHSALGPATCTPVSTSPVTSLLPATFAPVPQDEIYYYTMIGPSSQIAVNCSAYGSAPRPVAWTRTEGMGRVFYSGLGHTSAAWIDTPNNPSLMVHKLVFPALLWTIGR